VNRELDFWSQSAKSQHDICLEWEEALKDSLTKSYKMEYGVRSIKSAVENRVVNELAKAHSRGDIGRGAAVRANVDNKGRVVLRKWKRKRKRKWKRKRKQKDKRKLKREA